MNEYTSPIMWISWLEVLFIFLWNSGFIGAEFGLLYAGPWTLLFWRHLGLAVLLAIVLKSKNCSLQWRQKEIKTAAIVGVLAHGVWLVCVLIPLNMNVPAGIVALITALQPLMTGAFSGLVVGERTKAHQWWGLVIGFLGVAIAVGTRLLDREIAPTFAYLIPLGSVFGITAASLIQRKQYQLGLRQKLPLTLSLFYQVSAAALVLLLPAWWFESLNTVWTVNFIGILAWLMIAVSFGAYWVMWKLLKRQSATLVASLFYFSPPVTMFMAWLAFGDVFFITDFIGLIVAGLGVVLVYKKT